MPKRTGTTQGDPSPTGEAAFLRRTKEVASRNAETHAAARRARDVRRERDEDRRRRRDAEPPR